MTFIDNSAQTQADLQRIGVNSPPFPEGEPLINMGINGPGGVGVTAGNLGLPGYRVALGFTEGTETIPDAAKSAIRDECRTSATSRKSPSDCPGDG